MPESVTRSEKNSTEQLIERVEKAHEGHVQSIDIPSDELGASAAQEEVIWTPRFIVIFALTVVVGLSIANILTQGWLNGYYKSDWAFLAYAAPVFGCWIALLLRARSPWIRMGAAFGCIWSVFSSISFVLDFFSVSPHSIIVAHLNAAIDSALLGSYICLSIARTPIYRWDSWFFKLVPILSGSIVVVAYFLAPTQPPALDYLEHVIALVALSLSTVVWWIRPSCWRTQPGPTLLFGVVPFILLLFAIPNNTATPETYFFYTLVILLCLLLGNMRLLQCEIIH